MHIHEIDTRSNLVLKYFSFLKEILFFLLIPIEKVSFILEMIFVEIFLTFQIFLVPEIFLILKYYSLFYIYICIYSFQYIKHNLTRNYHVQKMQSFSVFFFFFCLNSRRCEKYEFYPIGNNIRNNNVTNSYIFRTVTLFNFTRKTSYVKRKTKDADFYQG